MLLILDVSLCSLTTLEKALQERAIIDFQSVNSEIEEGVSSKRRDKTCKVMARLLHQGFFLFALDIEGNLQKLEKKLM